MYGSLAPNQFVPNAESSGLRNVLVNHWLEYCNPVEPTWHGMPFWPTSAAPVFEQTPDLSLHEQPQALHCGAFLLGTDRLTKSGWQLDDELLLSDDWLLDEDDELLEDEERLLWEDWLLCEDRLLSEERLLYDDKLLCDERLL